VKDRLSAGMKTPQKITLITLYFKALTKSTSTLLCNRSRGHRPLTALAQAAVPAFASGIHYPDSGSTSLVIGRWTWIQQYDRFTGPVSLAENTTTANISMDKVQLFAYPKTDGIEQEEVEILFQQEVAQTYFRHTS
jgi:hypothetical protein